MKVVIITALAVIIFTIVSHITTPRKPMNNIDKNTQQIVTDIAKKEIQKHKTNFGDYYLTDIKPIQGQPGKYFVRFELPDTDDAKIEMIIDANSAQVSDFKDNWA